MKHTLRLPDSPDQPPANDDLEWGYVAVTDDLIIGSKVKSGSAYQGYWAKAAWYDGKGDASTSKVCGSGLVVYDKKYGDVRWQRDVDAMVQSTITISGDRIYMVEADDPDLRKLKTGK